MRTHDGLDTGVTTYGPADAIPTHVLVGTETSVNVQAR